MEMSPEDFARMLGGNRVERDESFQRPPLADELAELKTRAEDYIKPVSFKVGDLVTAKAGTLYRGAGAPHMVIDVEPDAKPVKVGSDDAGSPSFGNVLNMRILTLAGPNRWLSFWVEAANFEPFTGVSTQESAPLN